MGFFSWLTGRSEKEQDVYANYERVDDLVTNLKKISTDNVTTASEAVKAAVIELNNVNGMAEFVGQVSADCFTPTFDAVASTIDQIGAMVQQKADNIKVFEESAWYEKLGSTFAMTGAKLGEGILSVVEDLGDGVVSLVGWVAPKDSGVEKWCSEFVQKEWSHDTFNFYYNSEFAKKSAFTEDSALASACKIIGTTATYMFAGGLVAGAGKASAAAKVTSTATKTGKLAAAAAKAGNAVSKIGGLASASTWGATAVAGVAGLGSGTENALVNGAGSFDQAFGSGVKTGIGQAALAFAGGKLGEKIAKTTALKGANQNLTSAADDFTKAIGNTSDDAVRIANHARVNAVDNLAKVAANSTDEAVKAAQQAVVNTSDDVLRAAANSTDDVIKVAQKAVTSTTDDLVKAAANSADDAVKAAGKVAAAATDDLTKAIANTSDDAVKAAQKALTTASDDLAKAVANGSDDAIKAAQKAVTNASDGLTKAIANTSDDAIKAAQKVVTNATDDLVKVATNSTDDAIKATGKIVANANDDLAKAISNSSDKTIKSALKAAANANDSLTKAIANTSDDAVKIAQEATQKAADNLTKAIANTSDDALKAANQSLDDAMTKVLDTQSSKLSSYEGYDDVISRSGRDVGEKAMQNVIDKGLIKGTAANIGAVGKAGVNAAGNVIKTTGNAVMHPVQTVKNLGTNAINTGKDALTTVGNAVRHPIQTAQTVGTTALNTARVVGTAVVHNPGAVAQGINATISNANAADNIASLATPDVEIYGPTVEDIEQDYVLPTGEEIPTEQQYRMEDVTGTNPIPDNNSGGGGYTGGGGGGYTGGGGGGYTGGGDTGGTTYPGTTDPGTTTPGTTDPGTTYPGTTDPWTGDPYTGPSDGTGDGTHTGSGFGGDDEFNGAAFEIDDGFGDDGDEFDSLADIIENGDKLTEIPQSSTPIKANSNGGASAVIPIAAGLSAAAAAGIGAKVFMDKKNNAENGEDDEFDTDDWSEDGQIEIDYDESEGSIADQYLNDEDDYGYQADTGEKYGARSSEELADLQ